MSADPHYVTLDGCRIECELIRTGASQASTIVFLHEGLGSIAMWKDFPSRVAHAAGCNALVYSRRGHGRSDSLAAPHRIDFMHGEALATLPALLDAFGIDAPVLLGHSTGASIALIHAGESGRPVAGVVAMAPHVIVEDLTLRSIAAARGAYATTDLPQRLVRHHRDPDAVFASWTDIWLTPSFRTWNIEGPVARIRCPVLAIPGEDDEYGTMDQIERIARLAPDVDLVKLSDCRHSPHRDQPDAVIEAVVRFVDRIR
jgi:pimeloyl-ACP methyl ester carboxylesterase